jgi:hypothetical protein
MKFNPTGMFIAYKLAPKIERNKNKLYGRNISQ